jgi:LysM repeat protein
MATEDQPAIEELPEIISDAEPTEGEQGIDEMSAESGTSVAITATLEALSPAAQPITATVTAEATAAPTLAPAPTATAVPPTATQPAPAATATPAKAAGSRANTYRVKSGDTLSGIAQQFDVSLDALLAANRIAATATLRIGQVLVIPGTGVPPPPTVTPRPPATATPTALPVTPTPFLPVPVLSSPGDQARYGGDKEQIFLVWEAIPGMSADDKYQVILRWTEQGGLQEKSDLFTTATSIQVPTWLWGRADQPVRKYLWFIRAVRLTTDGQGGELVIPLSPPSEIRTIYWN